MANSNNVYSTEKPLEGTVSDWVNQQERMDFAYRDEARKVAALEQAAKDRNALKLKDLNKDYELKPGDATGLKTYDEAAANIYKDAIEKNNELYKKERSGQQLTSEEISLKRKLQQLPETLQLMTKTYQDQNARYNEGVKSGKLKRDVDYEATLAGMATNAKAFIDREGNPVIGIDKDGDGKIDFLKNDFNGLSIQPNLVNNLSVEEAIKEASKNLEVNTTQTDTGEVKRLKSSLPLSAAKSKATQMAINPNGTLTPLAISYFYDLGVKKPEDVTDKQLNDFEAYLTKSLIDSKGKIDKTDKDINAGIALRKEKKDNEKVTTTQVATPPLYTNQGFTSADGYKSVAVSGKTTLPEITAANGTTYTNAGIQSYTVGRNKKGERYIIAELVYQDTKNSKASTNPSDILSDDSATVGAQNKSVVVPLSQKDAQIYASQLGFKDTKEMADAARAVSSDKEDRRPSASNYGL